MKKIRVFLHLLSFIFFTSLFSYWLLSDIDKSKIEIYGISCAYLLFVIPPILSLALQYEVSKDRMFFNKFINSNTENLKMDDYLRIYFLLFYHLGAYTGVELRKILLKKKYRNTDMVHLELIREIIKRKKCC